MHAIKPGQQAYGTFASALDPETKYTDFSLISRKIEAETERVCGPRGLSTIPILLDIYSPDVVDLTLVDLPGAVRVAADDQDPTIVSQITGMINDYIRRENVIILAVSAANTDLANSDALAFSRNVDPRGERTLAVLTKLDLMDDGTDARDVLTGAGDGPKLTLGYVGVVNRSQRDTNEGATLDEARAKEGRFFSGHPAYSSLAAKQGTKFLVQRCSQLLVHAIQRELPGIDAKVKELISRKEEELAALPETTPATMRRHYHEITRQFEDNFLGLLGGNIGAGQSALAASVAERLVGGARINNLFDYAFRDSIMSLSAVRAAAVRKKWLRKRWRRWRKRRSRRRRGHRALRQCRRQS